MNGGGSHAALLKNDCRRTGLVWIYEVLATVPAGNWPEGQVGGSTERASKQGAAS